MNDLLAHLTDAQREAVEHIDGPLLILAGPGSGKTRVITHRIANLLRHGIPSRHILGLTFTNKAAGEMKARVEQLAPNRPVWISTFHRFCARLLREYSGLVGLAENFTIYDTSDSLAALKRAVAEADVRLSYYSPQRVLTAIGQAKNQVIGHDQFEPRRGDPLAAIVAEVYPLYQRLLLESSAVDFDDLLLHVARLLRDNPEVRAQLDARYRHVLVDEYQDTNYAQYVILRGLSIDFRNLAVTGDPDQSIYSWRGADIGNILDFERDYPDVRVVRLERNYRSTKRILAVAAALIANTVRRKEKDLFTEKALGGRVRLVRYATNKDEADGIAERIVAGMANGRRARDFAIFYRTNALSRPFEEALIHRGVPYQVVHGVEFYQRKEIKDVLAYLILLNNPRDDGAFLRIFNTPPRGLGKSTVERLREHARRVNLPMLAAARQSGLIETLPKKAAVGVARFVALFDKLNAISHRPVEEIIGYILSESGYQEYLRKSDETEDGERLANVEELLSVARTFDEEHPGDSGGLEAFLENSSLTGDTDDWEEIDDRVTLMTLHGSKGLEFPVVFVVAVETGLLPHERSQEHPDQLEEERRLLFVGLTRAREELQLSLTQYRDFRGRRAMSVPSAFLTELPLDDMDVEFGEAALVEGDPFSQEERHGDAFEWEGDISFDPDQEFEPAASENEPSQAPNAAPVRVMTAAELEGGNAPVAPRVSADVFHQGMIVKHPEYGLGKIVALGGSDARRTATVHFATAGERKFVLQQSVLRPVRSG